MAQTLPDIPITQEWQSINTLSGISVGDFMVVNNKSLTEVILSEGTKPPTASLQGVVLTSYRDHKSTKEIIEGSLEIWARIAGQAGTARITIQGK